MPDDEDPLGFKKLGFNMMNKDKQDNLFKFDWPETPFGSLFSSPQKEEAQAPRMVDVAAKRRALESDLVIPPQGYTNCGNCEYYSDNYCDHPKVAQEVEASWCCSLWDAPGTVRVGNL